jgi:hypothetical protein
MIVDASKAERRRIERRRELSVRSECLAIEIRRPGLELVSTF